MAASHRLAASFTLLLLLCLEGCKVQMGDPPSPLDHFSLVDPPQGPAERPRPGGLRIFVKRFLAPEVLQDDRILLSQGPRLRHFSALRWTDSPAEMTRSSVVRALQASGAFEWVDRDSMETSGAAFVLEGEVQHLSLSLLVGPKRWQGQLRLGYQVLQRARSLNRADGTPYEERLIPWVVRLPWHEVPVVAYGDPLTNEADPTLPERIEVVVQRLGKKLNDVTGELAKRCAEELQK